MKVVIKFKNLEDEKSFDPVYYQESNMVVINHLREFKYEVAGEESEINNFIKELTRNHYNFIIRKRGK